MSASGGRGNSTGFYLDGGVDEDTYDQVANVYPTPTQFKSSAMKRTITRPGTVAVVVGW